MLAVLLACLHDCLEPLLGAGLVSARRAHRIPYRVVIGNGVLGFILRVAGGIAGVIADAVLEQRRIEDRLLGVGMSVETHAEDIPDRCQLVGRFGVVESEELAPQPIVVGVDEIDDVSHYFLSSSSSSSSSSSFLSSRSFLLRSFLSRSSLSSSFLSRSSLWSLSSLSSSSSSSVDRPSDFDSSTLPAYFRNN